MPIDHTNRIQVDSMSDTISFAVDSSDQIQELLKKKKGSHVEVVLVDVLEAGSRKNS
jgi:hypothetical protein